MPDTSSGRFSKLLLEDFDERWFGDNDSVFDGKVRRGAFNRQIGIHPALMIATFLDPRLKNLGSVEDENDKKTIHAHVLKLMEAIEQKNRDSQLTMEEALNSALEDLDDDDDNDDDDAGGMMERMMAREQSAAKEVQQLAPGEVSVHDKCMAELKRFLSTSSIPVVGDDPLSWWKAHEAIFPILALLANMFLAIQASSAPSERVFSQALLLISAKRTRMNPKIAGKTLFVKQNWERFKSKIDYLKVIAGKEVDEFLKQLEESDDEL